MSTLERLASALADRYRVDRELGAGGMATVYLAHDLRHERDVAIKVLHPDLGAALGADRFLAEIKTTAKLQHPHILPLLDSGEADGLLYYVMPYVRGETLRARLERETQLPIADAIRIAGEVAGALQTAHEAGIVHRDIKPENILLQNGHALVADFGIALAVQQAGGQRMTQTGLSLGTPQYMSPEQASGERQVDARSDVYALGAVTYEMLTGAPPFTGASTAAVIARVLASPPESMRLARSTVPAELDAAVLNALAKLPADRPASAQLFAESLTAPPSAGDAKRSRDSHSARPRWYTWAAVAMALLAGTVASRALWPAPREAAHYRIDLGSGRLFTDIDVVSSLASINVSISPDGRTIVFSDPLEPDRKLRRKDRTRDVPEVIPGTDGAVTSAFAPDGRWIVFSTTQGQLKKLDLVSGQSVTIANDARTDVNALVWLEDGSVIYGSSAQWSVVRVAPDGKRSTLKLPPDVKAAITSMTYVPGNRYVLFAGCMGNCVYGSNGYLYDLQQDSLRLLVPDATVAAYSRTGHLLYVTREAGLFAVPFDTESGRTSGTPKPVLEGVSPFAFLLSAEGTVLFERITSTDETARSLVWVSREGRETPVDSTWKGVFSYPAIAPDGKTIAVSLRERETALWIRRADGSRGRVTTATPLSWRPRFADGGKTLYFIGVNMEANGESLGSLYRTDASLTTAPQVVLSAAAGGVWEVEVSGGRRVIRRGRAASRAYDLGPDDSSRVISEDSTAITEFSLSPDGRWLAFTSTITGRPEVYVAEYPSMRSRQMVSTGGGFEPRWSASGATLYFVSQGQMMAASISTAGMLRIGTPTALFDVKAYLHAQNRQHYDVSPDEQCFLMIRLAKADSYKPLVLIENWDVELRARLAR